MFSGHTIRVQRLNEGFVELCFDREKSSINKLDAQTLDELTKAIAAITDAADVRGVLVRSAKDSFIVGADITEFPKLFTLPEEQVVAFAKRGQVLMNALEDLPVPTVAAIEGFALGGGFEVALACDLRVMSSSAQVGFPEVKLGLLPGYGRTVRMARLAGNAMALEWITTGDSQKGAAAQAAGVVSDVVGADELVATALDVLKRAASGAIDWRQARSRKLGAVADACAEAVEKARERVKKAGANKHQPAAETIVDLLANAADAPRDVALELEAQAFARLAKTQAADSLVQIFLNEQLVKKKAKEQSKQAHPLRQAAVLGAGIMGGGIAYTSAVRGTRVLLKDIQPQQLEAGVGEAKKLLAKQVSTGRLEQKRADEILQSIKPQLDYNGFENVDIVVEAVVENLKIKHTALSEVERLVRPDSIIASNTSSLRIDDLAKPLSRPENFLGMHFFNPVPVMPLVEVIRGSKTSSEAVAAVVGYAVAMGKTPIVVKDGPGFLVNRILTPYMLAFMQLVREGVDFVRIDQVMEGFGWPMGPAYLNDVIGMDTGTHVFDVICDGFPQRLRRPPNDAVQLMKEKGRLGQKNGVGFYKYEKDPAGKPKKSVDPDSYTLLASVQQSAGQSITDQEIIDRMMLPMMVEAAWCLQEQVVETPHELDMALLLGLGCPRYLGGALKYADWLGLERVVALSDRYAEFGEHYRVPPSLREKAAQAGSYYSR